MGIRNLRQSIPSTPTKNVAFNFISVVLCNKFVYFAASAIKKQIKNGNIKVEGSKHDHRDVTTIFYLDLND
jgi:hypothetical protein